MKPNMKRSFRMLLCALLAVAGVGVFGAGAFGADVTITLGQAAFTGSGDNRGVYYPELTISSFGAGTYKGIMVAFTGELVSTDEIKISAVDGISENTTCSTKISKIIKFDGDKNSAQIQNLLRNGVKLYSQKNPKGQKVRLLLLKAAVDRPTIYCNNTKHYYQYVRYSDHKPWLDCYKRRRARPSWGGADIWRRSPRSRKIGSYTMRATAWWAGSAARCWRSPRRSPSRA